jgi:hypothetical protein
MSGANEHDAKTHKKDSMYAWRKREWRGVIEAEEPTPDVIVTFI